MMSDITLCGNTYWDMYHAPKFQTTIPNEILYRSDSTERPKDQPYYWTSLKIGDHATVVIDLYHPDPRGKGQLERRYTIFRDEVSNLESKGLLCPF